MKRFILGLAASAAAVTMASAANAAPVVNGASGVVFTAFNVAEQGTLLASASAAGNTANYTATGRYAVYRNIFGTLDFYYQVAVNTMNADDALSGISAFNFAGFTVDAMFSAADVDGGGIFTAANNPNPGGFTSTASRNAAGGTIRSDFNANTLVTGETSATYIFRTNATNFGTGTFTLQDGLTANIIAFAPTSAIPEPATWGLMLLGFGAMGGMLRTRNRKVRVRFA